MNVPVCISIGGGLPAWQDELTGADDPSPPAGSYHIRRPLDKFGTMPAFTTWRRSRERQPTEVVRRRGESALLTQPAGVVTWHEIDAGTAAFLTACGSGDSIAVALDSVAGAGLDDNLA